MKIWHCSYYYNGKFGFFYNEEKIVVASTKEDVERMLNYDAGCAVYSGGRWYIQELDCSVPIIHHISSEER